MYFNLIKFFPICRTFRSQFVVKENLKVGGGMAKLRNLRLAQQCAFAFAFYCFLLRFLLFLCHFLNIVRKPWRTKSDLQYKLLSEPLQRFSVHKLQHLMHFHWCDCVQSDRIGQIFVELRSTFRREGYTSMQ